MRVLIVDDEQAFAEPLAQRLELRGIEAAVAGDAETALGMLSRQEWDLVFLDVCLPGMDGVSLLKLLQEHEPRPDVVMLSGATEMSQAVKAMRRGALNWLAKPVSLDAVLEECRKARERAESRRQARRLAEEARLRSLGRIAEGVAHEVNNPLNIIVQAAGLMGDSLDSPEAEALPDIEDLRESLKAIVTQSMRVREITRKLLMAGVGLDPRSAPMDVQAVVSRVLTLLQGRMDSLKVTCRLHFPPEWGEDAPRPLGSALELEQICLHLVENALDAMPEGGTLDIGARLLPADDDGTTWYELSVADSGTGIADDIMPHIFEPFFTTHRQAGRAAGLGLSVATGLAHGRGGQITAAPAISHTHTVPAGPSDRQGLFFLRLPGTAFCRPDGILKKRLSSRCVVCPHPVDSGKCARGAFFSFQTASRMLHKRSVWRSPRFEGPFFHPVSPCAMPAAPCGPISATTARHGRRETHVLITLHRSGGTPQRGQVHSVQPPDPQQPRHHP